MIEMGLIVALGLLVTLAKLPWPKRMWVISHPLTMDVVVFVFLTTIHWGSFSGVMIATAGALFTSVTLSAARWLYGHVEGNTYFPGVVNVVDKLKE